MKYSSDSQAVEDTGTQAVAGRWGLLISEASVCRSLPALFAVIAIAFGLLYAFILPPLQAPDEFAHLFRAYGLSQGHFVAPVLTSIPASISALTVRYPPHLEAVRKVTGAELVTAIHYPLKPGIVTQVTNEGMNVNTWVPYIPSAIAILVARPLNISSLGLLYVSRLANLVGYVALTWLALHLLQGSRMILYAFGLMPMVLHQAASISWDSIVFGIAFVFCALIFRYTMNGSKLATRQCVVLLGAVVIVSLCKVDFALLPLVLLLPLGCFGSRKRQIAFLAICGSAAFLTNAIWQYANRVNLELFRQSINALLHSNFPGNIWYLYYNTGYFLNALGRTVIETGFNHLTEFVGTFGWLYVKLPAWAVVFYVLVLLTAGLAGASELRFSWFQRAILLGVVLLGSFGCVLAMWLTTPTSYIQDAILHNFGSLSGIQGRHFIPFGFAALVLLANRYLRAPSVVLVACITACAITVNTVAVMAIHNAY